MSPIRDLPSSSAKPPGGNGGGDGGNIPDPRAALLNLSTVQSRMDKLHRFLWESVNTNTLIGKEGMDTVSTEISSAVHQIIVNGAALLASNQNPSSDFRNGSGLIRSGFSGVDAVGGKRTVDPKVESVERKEAEEEEGAAGGGGGGGGDDCEIIEVDAVEILAEHIHFCEICGKGFKRDANLRMHMRAHGNQFKTPEALAKPAPVELLQQSGGAGVVRKTRFSCPYVGCNRNKKHKKFRALKSAICVKNHFKRSHCPKMYSCNICNKKSFSVMADLRSHLKHCGETKWKCSCGTSFSRKDKLFGHMALFEGHMPAVPEEEELEEEEEGEEDVGITGKVTESSSTAPVPVSAPSAMVEDYEEQEQEQQIDIRKNEFPNQKDEFFHELLSDGFDSIDKYCFQDLVGSPNQANRYSLGTGIDEFFNF